MTPLAQRTFNTIASGILISIGILSWLGSFYFIAIPNEPMPVAQKQLKIDLNSCQNALSSINLRNVSITEGGKNIEIYEPFPSVTGDMAYDEKNLTELMTRVSLASSLCDLSLKEFCAGSGCARNGIFLKMSQ